MGKIDDLHTDLRNPSVVASMMSAADIAPTQPLDSDEREIFDTIIAGKPPDQWRRMPLDIELATILSRFCNRHRCELEELFSGDLVVSGSFGLKVHPRLGVIQSLTQTILRLQMRLGLAPSEAQEQKIRSKMSADKVAAMKTLLDDDDEALLPRVGLRPVPTTNAPHPS